MARLNRFAPAFVLAVLYGEGRLRNPWPDKTVTFHRDGRRAEDLSGSLLTFPTAKGETIVIVLEGSIPARRKVL